MPITIRGSTSSSLRLGTGNVSNPSLSFANAPNTGFYLTQGNIGFSVAGVEKARVTPSGLVVSGNVSATNFVINGSTIVGAATTLVSNVQVANSTYSVLDDTAVSTDGGYIVMNGSGFIGGSMVLVDGTPATSTTVLGYTQLGAAVQPKAAGTYSVTVVRPDSVSVNVPLGITYSSFPAWSTSTDLGNVTQNTAFTRTLAATSDSNVTYANTSALPPQTTLASNGTLSGNITSVVDDTTYTFGITAQDLEFQDVPRTFSLQYFLAFIARKLTASDKASGDNFGNSVAMSADGNYMVVGAYYADPGGITDAGAAYVYRRSGTTWVEESKLTANDKASYDNFGERVSISSDGSRVVVTTLSTDSGGLQNAGAAYVYVRSGSTWTQETKLTASDKAANDFFGSSVAMTLDGTRVIVGSYASDPGGTSNAGAAYIFTRSGSTWTEEAKIFASDKASSDYFGISVAISSDGSRVIVGAYYASVGGTSAAGAAYVFTRSGSTWTQETKLTASDKAVNDFFGSSMAMTPDGTRVIVGASYASPGGTTRAGAAYVFTRSGTSWTEESKLIASDKQTYDYFGQSVAISSDGSRVIVGGHQSQSPAMQAGAAYIFSISGTTWTQESKLFASDEAVDDNFGISVTMNSAGTRVGIGAYNADPGGIVSAGAAYICGYSGGAWVSY